MINENTKLPASLKVKIIFPENLEEVKEISLAKLSNEKLIVLYFYPKDNTPGCTIEAQLFRDSIPEFKKLNAQIIGISKDNEKSHCSFIKKQELNFPLISDDGSICDFFGVFGEKKMYGKTYLGIFRSTFLLFNGKVIKKYEKVDIKNHAKEILEYLKSR